MSKESNVMPTYIYIILTTNDPQLWDIIREHVKEIGLRRDPFLRVTTKNGNKKGKSDRDVGQTITERGSQASQLTQDKCLSHEFRFL